MTEPPNPPAAGSSLPPTPTAAHDQLGAAFKRSMVAVRRLRGRETHRPDQLSYSQYALMLTLAGLRESSARDLAEHADLTPATVAQMLEALESQGLVARTRSDHDRRVVFSALTALGEQVVAARRAQMEPRWRAALDEFDETELVVAARVLHQLANYFDALLDDGVPVATGDPAGDPGPAR